MQTVGALVALEGCDCMQKLCEECIYAELPLNVPPCKNCGVGSPLWTPKSGNPYWERITALADKQRAKGMSKYGQGLEVNPADILARINHLQEELIDGLMYCEWIKEWVQENLKNAE